MLILINVKISPPHQKRKKSDQSVKNMKSEPMLKFSLHSVNDHQFWIPLEKLKKETKNINKTNDGLKYSRYPNEYELDFSRLV